MGISIHALREEGDALRSSSNSLLFTNFYPRPPRGGRPAKDSRLAFSLYISIHALREEGDTRLMDCPAYRDAFLSTPSARRATKPRRRTEQQLQYFYPRPPRGGRPITKPCSSKLLVFLSTPSARRATQFVRFMILFHVISIHALREEGDIATSLRVSPMQNFYPRPPRGGRQQKQRENPLLLSHYTPLCTNCKEVPVKQTAKSHRYLCKRLVFRCEASGKTMCAACSHWRGIKRSAHYPAQTPGAAQHARP